MDIVPLPFLVRIVKTYPCTDMVLEPNRAQQSSSLAVAVSGCDHSYLSLSNLSIRLDATKGARRSGEGLSAVRDAALITEHNDALYSLGVPRACWSLRYLEADPARLDDLVRRAFPTPSSQHYLKYMVGFEGSTEFRQSHANNAAQAAEKLLSLLLQVLLQVFTCQH